MTSSARPFGSSFFRRHGYSVDAPERVEREGVDFDRYRMSKPI